MAESHYQYEAEIQGDAPPFHWKLLRRVIQTNGAISSTQYEVKDQDGDPYADTALSREDALFAARDAALEDAAVVRWQNSKHVVDLFRTDRTDA